MKVDDLPEQESNPVPEGSYTLGVHAVEAKTGKESGQAYLSVEYSITEGEHKGRHLFDNISLSGKSVWMLKKWLVALGQSKLELPIDKGADDSYVIDEQGCIAAIKESVKGFECRAYVTVREANEEKGWKARNDVGQYEPAASFAEPNWAE